jgi:hypothetical protein
MHRVIRACICRRPIRVPAVRTYLTIPHEPRFSLTGLGCAARAASNGRRAFSRAAATRLPAGPVRESAAAPRFHIRGTQPLAPRLRAKLRSRDPGRTTQAGSVSRNPSGSGLAGALRCRSSLVWSDHTTLLASISPSRKAGFAAMWDCEIGSTRSPWLGLHSSDRYGYRFEGRKRGPAAQRWGSDPRRSERPAVDVEAISRPPAVASPAYAGAPAQRLERVLRSRPTPVELQDSVSSRLPATIALGTQPRGWLRNPSPPRIPVRSPG